MKKNLNRPMILSGLLSVVLMSLPYLVPHLGFLALFGFIPLLCMDALADSHHVKRFWIWYYLVFALWNAVTTFWVCNATVGGGIFASLANAFQMAVVFGLFRLSKKTLGERLSYVFLAVMWIAWERAYFSAQISWPWLTLGNAFARTIWLAQWYEFTGTLGGSLWIWASNLLGFHLLMRCIGGEFSGMPVRRRAALAGGWLLVLFAPAVVSVWIYTHYEEDRTESLEVVIAQPNIDPYHKFQALTQGQQAEILMDLLGGELADYTPGADPLLLLAPETFTNDVELDAIEAGGTWNFFQRFLSDYPNANLLYGASTYERIYTLERPNPTAYQLADGSWLQPHNSALITDFTGRTELFHKSKLVVGVEMMPYPKIFRPLDEKLGGLMGRDIGQDGISLLHAQSLGEDGRLLRSVPLGCAICYESVYGEYCTGYVRAGAEALTIITNDAWWGNTPGYRQHLSYASLRAIETRRDIARCGNTGISAFIDQRGGIVSRTAWWQPATLRGRVYLNREQTFFVRYGDIVGRVSTFLFLLLLLAAVVRFFVKR